jgi:predicted dehydrogenase
VIATPTATHAELTRAALLAGKHVLVEKPLCVNSQEGRELAALADSTGLVLIVGHIFLHNNGIKKLRELTVDGKLGKIQYLDAVRTNLGPIRGDVNALFDLGTHDISIFNYLVGAPPVEVSATGRRISQSTQEDVCFATLRYADGTLGHIHVSWLNPRKVRTLTVVGEKKMAHWDDVDPVDALRLYDIRIEEPPQYDSFGEFQYRLRTADIHLPKIQRVEPLVNQANAFLDAIRGDTTCRASAAEGVAVVAVLEAAAQSMREGGQSCLVDNSMILEPAGRNS